MTWLKIILIELVITMCRIAGNKSKVDKVIILKCCLINKITLRANV